MIAYKIKKHIYNYYNSSQLSLLLQNISHYQLFSYFINSKIVIIFIIYKLNLKNSLIRINRNTSNYFKIVNFENAKQIYSNKYIYHYSKQNNCLKIISPFYRL
ncbi:unnamed protein product [Paramecium sonneborni]|uniref:Uncharacterized protein n=1 Tax=Paramecium sonneborni TaxID=65129 RepID=A0A8S1REM5_9CILI|nr:unnamed protein product [Paramecium sonneborni]